MNPDSLHSLVTSAIWHAEQLEAYQVSAAPIAWAEVSSLEEDLATVLPVSQPEGRIARRGAVRAAIKAGEYLRASALAERFLSEEDAPEALRASLREMLKSAEVSISDPNQPVSKSDVLESPKLWERFYLRSEGWRITHLTGGLKGFPLQLGMTFLVGRQDPTSNQYCLVWLDESGLVKTLDGVLLKKGGQLEVTFALGSEEWRIIAKGGREKNKARIEGSVSRRAKRANHDKELGSLSAEGNGGEPIWGLEATG